MKKISTNLWFDNQAEEAADFYVSVFDGKLGRVVHYGQAGQEIHGQKPGSTMTVDFTLADHHFVALNGGPVFTLNPSVSFILNFDPSKDDDAGGTLQQYWDKLSDGGAVLMELGEYPFSKKYGWVQDKYGVSWQLMLTDPEGEDRPFITPSVMFVGDNSGRAEEAINFYTSSVFKNARVGTIARYPDDSGPAPAGALMFGDFLCEDTWFAAMDAGDEHDFNLNEAVSFVINCETQDEIDYYWEKLSAVPDSEVCGWLKDKYGVSWQIIPTAVLARLTDDSDPERADRVMSALLQMKKLDIAALEAAVEEK